MEVRAPRSRRESRPRAAHTCVSQMRTTWSPHGARPGSWPAPPAATTSSRTAQPWCATSDCGPRRRSCPTWWAMRGSRVCSGEFHVRHVSMLFPRRVVDRALPWAAGLRVSGDWDFVLRTLDHATVEGDSRPVTFYRRHGRSMTGTADVRAGESDRERVIERFLVRHPAYRGGTIAKAGSTPPFCSTARTPTPPWVTPGAQLDRLRAAFASRPVTGSAPCLASRGCLARARLPGTRRSEARPMSVVLFLLGTGGVLLGGALAARCLRIRDPLEWLIAVGVLAAAQIVVVSVLVGANSPRRTSRRRSSLRRRWWTQRSSPWRHERHGRSGPRAVVVAAKDAVRTLEWWQAAVAAIAVAALSWRVAPRGRPSSVCLRQPHVPPHDGCGLGAERSRRPESLRGLLQPLPGECRDALRLARGLPRPRCSGRRAADRARGPRRARGRRPRASRRGTTERRVDRRARCSCSRRSC